ncbi:hypothetical protein FN846DRAFT_893442 [Sphaerosporella brunnea]|uniref:Uncharacterized protein n=1 Tax=Sphaerosporella brunnea TaxID=1250544 RepID=A0A5J5EMJ2_9PEZI|nr:hypothetical protein FN846DRAFT_893442 [Sphaerosporella brunnea]
MPQETLRASSQISSRHCQSPYPTSTAERASALYKDICGSMHRVFAGAWKSGVVSAGPDSLRTTARGGLKKCGPWSVMLNSKRTADTPIPAVAVDALIRKRCLDNPRAFEEAEGRRWNGTQLNTGSDRCWVKVNINAGGEAHEKQIGWKNIGSPVYMSRKVGTSPIQSAEIDVDIAAPIIPTDPPSRSSTPKRRRWTSPVL